MPVPSSDTAELKKTILEAAQAMLAGTLPYTEGADILIKTESLWGPGDDVSLCLHEVRMKTAHVPRIAFRHL